MTEAIQIEVGPRIQQGMALRLFMLGTHYRSPINFTKAKLAEARKTWVRWTIRMEPTDEAPPAEFMAALMDDMNTPLALAFMHSYYKKKEGKKLYSAMQFLGLLPTETMPS